MRNTAVLYILASFMAVVLVAQTDEDHRKEMENSLSTGYQVSGSAPQRMNILDGMAFHHIPGASVALIHDGKVEWAGVYGVRQTAGQAVTTSTLFDVGSISKVVTAVGVLRLSQEGKIDLDRDVNLYLKRWKIPTNEWTSQRPVTVRLLLNHTAGFGESLGMVYAPTSVPTLLQQLDGLAPATNPPMRIRMLPGSRFEYSNAGYLVLELLVEDVTGKPFAEAMRTLVLDPLEMTHSTFEQPLPKKYAEDAASAFFGSGQKVGTPPEEFIIPNLAAGGLWSNCGCSLVGMSSGVL